MALRSHGYTHYDIGLGIADNTENQATRLRAKEQHQKAVIHSE
jgi:hypothetical protein